MRGQTLGTARLLRVSFIFANSTLRDDMSALYNKPGKAPAWLDLYVLGHASIGSYQLEEPCCAEMLTKLQKESLRVWSPFSVFDDKVIYNICICAKSESNASDLCLKLRWQVENGCQKD
jgi:hypothetical protein